MRRSVFHWQVLATIAYCDQFSYPLSSAEVYHRLLSSAWLPPAVVAKPKNQRQTTKKHSYKATVERALRELETAGYVRHARHWWALANSEELFTTRLHRQHIAHQKWREVAELVALVQWIPWIKAVAVTGALAMDNVTLHDDCDFLIVTQPRRLWLSRLAVTVVAWIKGKRRSWHGEEKDSWCFNLWLDTTTLAMPTSLQTVYGAYEVMQARWVFDRAGIQQAFYQANSWYSAILPLSQSPQKRGRSNSSNSDSSGNSKESRLTTRLGNILEEVVFQVQYWYMKRHMTREVVHRHAAFFHPRDTKKMITERWYDALLKTL